ncbi:MAG: sglT 2 [Planctomycetaceae bacterium]|nr:sglT 2 [Planctomycetaceae bacterium]
MTPETSLTTDSGLRMLDYAVIVLYMLSTFGIAVWFGRKQETTDDFFIGSRRMPWFAVGLSILATLFSTLSYLGSPGEMIKHGIGLFIGYLAIPFSMTVVFFLWIPFFMRLRVTSAYEYLERRFNYGVRLLGATLFIFLRLGWMSMVVYAASMALDRVKGDDFTILPGNDIYWWIVAVGIGAAIYTSVGGIQAMIWTDVLQCLLLLVGVLMVIFYVMIVDQTGPLDWWATAAKHSPEHVSPPLISFDLTVRVTIVWMIVNNFFWTVCTHGSDQVVLQRYFSTSSQKAARRSYLINVAVDLLMAGLLATAGLALLAFYLRHSELMPAGWTATGQADKLFPHFLGHQLPMGCAGLIIAAFICDAMQTLESGVNSITAVATNDIVPRLRQGRPRIVSELTFARLTTIVVTVIVTANACLVAEMASRLKEGTLISLMPRFFNLFVGPLSALFFIGMFMPRCTARSAIPAALTGLSVAIVWCWWQEIFNTSKGPTVFLAIAVPWLTSVGTALILSLLIEKGGPHAGRGYTWFAIVKGPERSD